MKNFTRTALLLITIISLSLFPVFAGGQEESTKTTTETLTVAMECGYAPYNWTQTTNANGAVQIKGSSDYAYGYDVMMAKLIAEKLGQDLQIVKLDWDSLVPAVISGSVDCVIAGQSITSDRLQMVDFTTPYYYASIVVLTTQGNKYANATSIQDLAGGTCTSQLGTIWYDVCLPQIENVNMLAAQESAPSMLVALNSGRVDYICTDLPTAQAAVVAYPNMKILDFTGTDGDFEVSQEEINIGISVSKKTPELTASINEALAGLTVEDFNRMMDEAISVQPLSN
ncbi:MAG: transporter substrate-binding domain-containing protein [Sphaerochaetaceae bacterium]